MSELAGARADAPEFVGAGDECAFVVPALNPCDAVIESEEAYFDVLATVVLDNAVLLAGLVVGLQQISL